MVYLRPKKAILSSQYYEVQLCDNKSNLCPYIYEEISSARHLLPNVRITTLCNCNMHAPPCLLQLIDHRAHDVVRDAADAEHAHFRSVVFDDMGANTKTRLEREHIPRIFVRLLDRLHKSKKCYRDKVYSRTSGDDVIKSWQRTAFAMRVAGSMGSTAGEEKSDALDLIQKKTALNIADAS